MGDFESLTGIAQFDRNRNGVESDVRWAELSSKVISPFTDPGGYFAGSIEIFVCFHPLILTCGCHCEHEVKSAVQGQFFYVRIARFDVGLKCLYRI